MGCGGCEGTSVGKFEECHILINKFGRLIDDMKENNVQDNEIINFEQESEKLKNEIKNLLIQINNICDKDKNEFQIRRFLVINEKFQNLCTEESNIRSIDLKAEQEDKKDIIIKNSVDI